MKCFDLLPVAGVIGGKVFAVHGGISPHMDSLHVRVIRFGFLPLWLSGSMFYLIVCAHSSLSYLIVR